MQNQSKQLIRIIINKKKKESFHESNVKMQNYKRRTRKIKNSTKFDKTLGVLLITKF